MFLENKSSPTQKQTWVGDDYYNVSIISFDMPNAVSRISLENFLY